MARPALLLSLGLLAGLLPALAACPQNCHCHGDLQHVICDKVGLQKIPKVSEKTKLLNLQRNNFPVLAANSFRAMPNLVSLHLQHCQIREVAAGAFRGLKQLIYLYLSHNDIRVLRAGAFDDLTELTYLYLDHNKVTELPRGLLSPLVNLFILQLNNNKIRELRAGAFQGAKDLRWLYLSENAISSLQPGALDDVENLAKFHLDRNQLSSYPSAALSKLRVVEELKLSHNPLKSIPDNAFQSFGRYLETLWLDNTNLEKVSSWPQSSALAPYFLPGGWDPGRQLGTTPSPLKLPLSLWLSPRLRSSVPHLVTSPPCPAAPVSSLSHCPPSISTYKWSRAVLAPPMAPRKHVQCSHTPHCGQQPPLPVGPSAPPLLFFPSPVNLPPHKGRFVY